MSSGESMPAPDWEAVRAEFPALANWTYLNTATYGQLPKRSVQAAARSLCASGRAGVYGFSGVVRRYGRRSAHPYRRLINC